MGMLVLTGRLANMLQRGTVTPGSEDADFPVEEVFDNDPGTVFSGFPVAEDSVDPVLTLDGDIGGGDGSFEAAFVDGAPVGWVDASTVDGALVQDTVVFSDGAASLRIETPATANSLGVAYKDYTVRAGEVLRIHLMALGDTSNGGSSALHASLQDLDTGQFLNSSLEWQDSSANFLVDSSDAFAEFDEEITVSPMSYWPKPIRRLRLKFTCVIVTSGDQEVWVDEVFIIPAYDTLSMFGHNLRPAFDVEWFTGDTIVGLTEAASFRPTSDKFYHRLTMYRTHRYQRIFVGPSTEALWIGEMVIGRGYHFTRTAASPILTTHIDHRAEVPKLMGGRVTRGLARSPRHVKTLAFQFDDVPETAESGVWREWHDEIFLRSLGGHPAVVVPTTDRDEVLFGHLSGQISEADGAPGQAGYKALDGFIVDELPLPVEVPSITA
jgi:hypothetical protein